MRWSVWSSFCPDTRLDQDRAPRRLDEDRIQAELDPVLAIGRRFFLPEHFGDDAEHRPAVQKEMALARPQTVKSPRESPRSSFHKPVEIIDQVLMPRIRARSISAVSMRIASSGQASTQNPQKQQRLRSMTNLAGIFLDFGVGVFGRFDRDAFGGANRDAQHAGDAAGLAVFPRHQAVEAAVARGELFLLLGILDRDGALALCLDPEELRGYGTTC